MKFKVKSWIWKLTFPFAHNNFTVLGKTIFYPKGYFPTNHVVEHEFIHMEQRRYVGNFWFYFAYLFALPILYNPWRYKWEYEAYKHGGLSDEQIHRILRSYKYGWLIFNGRS